MDILIVEDSPPIFERLVEALTTENLKLKRELADRGLGTYPKVSVEQITGAGNKAEALSLLDEKNFDLVLLDLFLPNEGGDGLPEHDDVLYGFDVLRAARRQSPPPEVIILSSYARRGKAGLIQFEEALRNGDLTSIPEDILWKEDYQDPDLFQRKVVSYLVELSPEDEKNLLSGKVFVPPVSIPTSTRRLLRKLKRVAWWAERGRPLPDVVLLGEKGTGKATLARALHHLRPQPAEPKRIRLGFEHVEVTPVHRVNGDPVELLAGTCGGDRWFLGALPRTTSYLRNGEWISFPGQKVHRNGRRPRTTDGVANVRLYPRGSDTVDFDASGTLYLEDPFYDKSEIQEGIEAIFTPDLDQRYVTTRGELPVRLQVGASVVLGVTQKHALERYSSKVSPIIIEVPPLRERSPQERLWLLQRFLDRRHGRQEEDHPAGAPDAIRLDRNMEEFIGEYLEFRGNFDDFQAIANQVLPEERSLSWRQLRPIWQRDHGQALPPPQKDSVAVTDSTEYRD